MITLSIIIPKHTNYFYTAITEKNLALANIPHMYIWKNSGSKSTKIIIRKAISNLFRSCTD